MACKLNAGDLFPKITVPKLGGGNLTLGIPQNGHSCQMIVVYRGKHCPICTRYLSELNDILPDLSKLGIDVVAVSADPSTKAREQISEAQSNYNVGYDLSIEQMKTLGLYISNPRSPEETDRPFAEPGLFFINSDLKLQIVDISNAPFVRPNLASLIMGLGYILAPENKYPIRGTYSSS